MLAQSRADHQRMIDQLETGDRKGFVELAVDHILPPLEAFLRAHSMASPAAARGGEFDFARRGVRVKPRSERVVRGNSLRLKDDFIGMANVTLIRAKSSLILLDTGSLSVPPRSVEVAQGLGRRAVGHSAGVPVSSAFRSRAQCGSVPAGEVPPQRARIGNTPARPTREIC